MSLDSFADRRPLLFSIGVTLAFLGLLLVAAAASSRLSATGQEAAGSVARFFIAVLAIALAARLHWLHQAGIASPGDLRSWRWVLAPALYVIAVYPLLFTGSYALNLQDPGLSALVGANGFAAGVMEELVFRGVILCALLRHWGRSRAGLARAICTTAALFGLSHALNLFFGHEPLRVAAQLAWALLLGGVFGALVVAGGSVWPAAVLHGVANAVVHVNRLGVPIEMTATTALLLAAAPLPLVLYAVFVVRGAGVRLPSGGAALPSEG